MNCAEFQKVLPYIIETGGNSEEEAHLRACPVCSDLVQDLRYIAEQAKLLLPMHDPGPQVWDNIQGSLEREGLLKPVRARGRLLSSTAGTLILGMGVLVLVFAVAMSRNSTDGLKYAPVAPVQANVNGPTAHIAEQDDQKLLTVVEQQRPQFKETYASNLKQVNAYVNDAQRTLEKNPNDEEARQHLLNAYDQKAVLYEMATRPQ